MKGRISFRYFASWRDLFSRFIRRQPKQQEKVIEPIDEQGILEE